MNKEDQFKKIGKDLGRWKRHLPHFQSGGRTLFVTWRCLENVSLSTSERQIVLDCIRHFHRDRYLVFTVVVMPDHTHLLLQPCEKSAGNWWNLGELLKGMKGVSARRINESRGTLGSLWQDERYDRQVRSRSDFEEKWSYIRLNPVRAGLVSVAEDWDSLWLPASIEGWLPN
ncbi:MAG: transposase [Planctomycetes bacterium]|nr:transposase [Planctomycetota bacterium]